MENKDKPAYQIDPELAAIGLIEQCQGLTKREVFAMAAMQGMIAGSFGNNIKGVPEGQEFITSWSLAYADALLKQLESKPL